MSKKVGLIMTNDTIRDAREPGFYMIDNELLDDYGPIIGAYGVAVYNVLARYANKYGENAFPSYNHIAEKLAFSRDSAIRSVKILVDAGLVVKRSRTSQAGDMTSNEYVLIHIKGTKPPQAASGETGHRSNGSSSQQPPSSSQLPPLVADSNHGSSSQLPYKDSPKNTQPDQDLGKKTNHQSATPAGGSFALPMPEKTEQHNVMILSNTLQMVGVGVTQFMIDNYMDMAEECGIHATIAGIQVAAGNNMQHRMAYVKACIRSAGQGKSPSSKKQTVAARTSDEQADKAFYLAGGTLVDAAPVKPPVERKIKLGTGCTSTKNGQWIEPVYLDEEPAVETQKAA